MIAPHQPLTRRAARGGGRPASRIFAAAKLVEAESRIAEPEASLRRGADGAGDQGTDTAELWRRIEEVAEEIMPAAETAGGEQAKGSRPAG